MLQGFDKDWIDAGTRRTAYYTNLAPSNYRFFVAARTNESEFSGNSTSFAFSLQPHFYQTYWFGFLVLAMLALAGYGIYRLRLQQVETRFNAVLAERNRIAREIHDTLAQGFVAVSLQLELASRKMADSPEAARQMLLQAREMVQNGLNEARQSIWELRSQSSGSSDLASRVSKMATEVTERSPLKVRFQVLGTNRPLPGKIESELLRISQEAVTNVVRHANAANLNIDLKYDSKKVSVTIADDGRGFEGRPNATGPEGHFGLKGMRERATEIGAKLEVASAPGKGTQITVEKEVS